MKSRTNAAPDVFFVPLCIPPFTVFAILSRKPLTSRVATSKVVSDAILELVLVLAMWLLNKKKKGLWCGWEGENHTVCIQLDTNHPYIVHSNKDVRAGAALNSP